MDVIWHCGDGLYVCETDLGESSENCCVDCPCPQEDDFCYTGNTLHGECVGRSEIQSGSVIIDPQPLECVIELENKVMCVFTSPTIGAEIDINNLPVGAEIVDSSYTINGLECRTERTECPMTCVIKEDMTGFDCLFKFQNLECDSDFVGGDEVFDGEFHITI